MRGFGYAAAWIIAVNIVAAIVSVATGWDSHRVLSSLMAGAVAWLCMEAYE